jgi:hypothetical protein
MVRRRGNPFADARKRRSAEAPAHKALLRREESLRNADEEELEAACKRTARGAEFLCSAGSRGAENGCICFDTPEKASAMQAWIKASGITARLSCSVNFSTIRRPSRPL